MCCAVELVPSAAEGPAQRRTDSQGRSSFPIQFSKIHAPSPGGARRPGAIFSLYRYCTTLVQLHNSGATSKAPMSVD